MTENAVNELLDRYLRGEASLEEKILVERVYQNELSRKQLSGEDLPDQEQKAQMWNTLYTRTHPIRKRTNRSGYFLFGSAAAAVILIVSTLILYSRLSTPAHLQKSIVASHSDIDPGGNNATLTFFNGKRIVLNKVAKGILSVESGVVIKKETEGRLICYAEPTDNLLSQSGQTFYSTLTTPNGGMYQLVLPDGSQVWLNAASALSFPSRFTANERRVTLSGEAYFEIAKDKKRPFKVETGKQVVEVLGTHFNINAYGDEGFYKTTLLEGSVKILSSTDSVIIKPGEQAKIFPQTKQKIKVEPGDTEGGHCMEKQYYYVQ